MADPIVKKTVRSLFPKGQVSEALGMLAEYQGPEQSRVQLAALKLSGGKLEKLRTEIDAAKMDYRDVLAYAEYPRQMAISGHDFQKMSAAEKHAVTKADRDEYVAWRKGLRPDDEGSN